MKKLCLVILCAIISIPLLNAQDSKPYVEEEIIYGRKHGMALTMVVLTPKKTNGKAVIHVVSGNWVSSYDAYSRWHLGAAKPFIENGYTVFMTMHRSNPRFDISEGVADVKRAVQFVRFKSEDFGIDPDNIGITGASSGGHVSLAVANSDDAQNKESRDPVEQMSSKVQAVAVFYPPTDFLNWGMPNAYMNYLDHGPLLAQSRVLGALRFQEFNANAFVYEEIDDPEKLKEVSRSLSPAHLVTNDDAPVYIIHGDSDKVVPLQQSQLLKKHFDSINVPMELKVVPGADHGWDNMNEDRKEFVKWFDKYLFKD